MARLGALRGSTVALDTMIFIYALEGNARFGEAALALFKAVERAEVQAVACELVLGELIVKPLKMGRDDVVTRYLEELPRFPHLSFRPVTRSVILSAAHLRVASGLGLADALHLAAAREGGASVFMTNDGRLKRPNLGIDVWLLGELTEGS